MGINVKSVLFCTTSLCLWCYILHFSSLEKILMVRCEFYTLGGHQVLELIPVPICKEPSKTRSQNLSWPKTGPISSLPALQRATWDLFQDPSDSGVPSPDLGTPWTYCSWHTEECTDSFCCKSSDHIKSKLCPQNIAVQINSPFISLSCIKQNLLRSLFWWNGHSLAGAGNHSRSSSHRRWKFPDKRYSSGLMKMNSVMQYPQKEQTADLQEIPLLMLMDSLLLSCSSSNSLSGEIQSKQQGNVNRTLLMIVNFRYLCKYL